MLPQVCKVAQLSKWGIKHRKLLREHEVSE